MKRLLWSIYIQPLHKTVTAIVVWVAIWALVGSRAGKKRWWRIGNLAVCLGIVAGILYATLYSRVESGNAVILTPFYSFLEAKSQPELYRSMLMNVYLFVPLGLSLPYVLSGRFRVPVTILLGLTLSVAVEWIQYRYGLGRCEADDVIMNTLGTAIGSMAWVIGEKIRGSAAPMDGG